MFLKSPMITWRYLDSPPGAASTNMAVDEALLARAQQGEKTPVLRFYTWNPPALSLGRFQDAEKSVDTGECARLGIDVVRRITGGRAVLHNKELTYSIVSPSDNPLFSSDVLGTYRIIAAGLVAGLHLLGIPAEIVSRSGKYAGMVEKKSKDPACFSSPSWYEIVVGNKKIIGSAQRRVRGGVLQHGSILLDYDPVLESSILPRANTESITWINKEVGRDVDIEKVKDAIRRGFQNKLGICFTTGQPAD
jgi:lipoyl(octanoyl) transferase